MTTKDSFPFLPIRRFQSNKWLVYCNGSYFPCLLTRIFLCFVPLQPFSFWYANKVYNYFLHLSSMLGVACPFCTSRLFLFRNLTKKGKQSNSCKMEMLKWHFPHLVSLLCFLAVFLCEVAVMKSVS